MWLHILYKHFPIPIDRDIEVPRFPNFSFWRATKSFLHGYGFKNKQPSRLRRVFFLFYLSLFLFSYTGSALQTPTHIPAPLVAPATLSRPK